MVEYGVSVLKKLLFIFLLLTSLLFGSDLKTEQRIYNLIIHTLLPNKEDIKVWGDSLHNKELLNTIPNVRFASSPQDADFLLVSKKPLQDPQGIIFVTDFNLLQKMKKSAVGGFFWQKGRPNILFLRKNLQKKSIQLPESMQDYIEDEI